MSERFRDSIGEAVCSRQSELTIGIGIFVGLLLMMGISLLVTEPGSASHTLAVINAVTLFGFITVCAAFILFCRH